MKFGIEGTNHNMQNRKERAEARNELCISHWRGELHSHTKTDINLPALPEDIVEYRKGSNCGDIPLEALLQYHAREMKNEFIAITEHSRDANTKKAISGMTEWFMGMYLSNNPWLQENYLKNKEDLSENELEEIKIKATAQAEQVALYGDERIEEILFDIDGLVEETEIKVFKGIEASLMPDGSLDTPMVEAGKFDMVNCSIHPNIDNNLFNEIINDPDKYSDLLIRGIENKRVNVMSHIGEGVNNKVVEKLRWDEIAEKAIKNNVAIEINLKKLMTFIYNEILDYNKYPKSDTAYRSVLESSLPKLIPIISSETIADALKPYFSQGLKIAINTDEHKNKFIKSETDKNSTNYNFIPRDLRYWRAMKIVEKYFNNLFNDLGIGEENIINTYNKEKIDEFLKK